MGFCLSREDHRPLLMGILNLTPDSFYDGGRYQKRDDALRQAEKMAREGADILDLGAVSTRPGSLPPSVEEELERLIPLLHALRREVDLPISVDTWRALVAHEAIAAGALMVNDISGLQFDAGLADVLLEAQCAICLMHSPDLPERMQNFAGTWSNVAAEVRNTLVSRADVLHQRGLPREKILIDPGIGFGKNTRENCQLIAALPAFVDAGYGVLMGVSRKRFLGELTGKDVEERLAGTAAAVALCTYLGARVLRVHDVGFMRDVLDVAAAIREHNA